MRLLCALCSCGRPKHADAGLRSCLCRLQGAQKIQEALEKHLGVHIGETTKVCMQAMQHPASRRSSSMGSNRENRRFRCGVQQPGCSGRHSSCDEGGWGEVASGRRMGACDLAHAMSDERSAPASHA